jgi:hypothetical protein
MNNVQLPLAIDTVDKMNAVYQKLINDHNVFLPMFQFDGKFYCRISAQIYMELKDYETVGRMVLNAIENENYFSIFNTDKDYLNCI